MYQAVSLIGVLHNIFTARRTMWLFKCVCKLLQHSMQRRRDAKNGTRSWPVTDRLCRRHYHLSSTSTPIPIEQSRLGDIR